MSLFKVIILLLFALIFFSLGRALFYLVRGDAGSSRVAQSLTWRIGLSVALFVLLLVGLAAGWIRPHGVLPVQQPPATEQDRSE